VSLWRTYKFDVFKVAHRYANGDMFFDNIENVKDKAFDFMTEAQKQAALDLESEQ